MNPFITCLAVMLTLFILGAIIIKYGHWIEQDAWEVCWIFSPIIVPLFIIWTCVWALSLGIIAAPWRSNGFK